MYGDVRGVKRVMYVGGVRCMVVVSDGRWVVYGVVSGVRWMVYGVVSDVASGVCGK